MACFPGWTYEYIDDYLTIPRVLEINAYHKKNPPIHVMIANYLGIQGPKEADQNGLTLFDIAPQTPK